MQTHNPSRRHFLQTSAAVASAGILQACGTSAAPSSSGNTVRPVLPAGRPAAGRGSGEDKTLRVVATSGFAPDPIKPNAACAACMMPVSSSPTNTPYRAVTNALPAVMPKELPTSKKWPPAAWPPRKY